MVSKWGTVQLKNSCSKIGSGATPKGGSSVYLSEGEFTLIRSQNVRNNFFDHNGLVFIEQHHAEKLSNVAIQANDILLNITGDSVARCCQVDPDVLPARVNQHVSIIRPIDTILDAEFLKYYLVSPLMQRQMLSMAGVGATRNALTKGMIEGLEMPKPPLPEQKAIAHVLGVLDDKIALNRQMNATLEGMAQALFKSWFVDFDPVIDNALVAGNSIPEPFAERAETRRQALADGTADRVTASHFPAAFHFTEELGYIPQGWEISTINDTTQTIIDHRGKTPKKLKSEWVESGFLAISAKNIKNNKLVRRDTIRYVDLDLYNKWMSIKLQKEDVLMTSEAPMGETLLLTRSFEWVLSQRLFALRANRKICGYYLYHWLNTHIAKADLDGRASGTTVQGVRQTELRKVKVLVATKTCIDLFASILENLYQRKHIIDVNITDLTKLRDTLLPKLISGEVRLTDAQAIVQEATA